MHKARIESRMSTRGAVEQAIDRSKISKRLTWNQLTAGNGGRYPMPGSARETAGRGIESPARSSAGKR